MNNVPGLSVALPARLLLRLLLLDVHVHGIPDVGHLGGRLAAAQVAPGTGTASGEHSVRRTAHERRGAARRRAPERHHAAGRGQRAVKPGPGRAVKPGPGRPIEPGPGRPVESGPAESSLVNFDGFK